MTYIIDMMTDQQLAELRLELSAKLLIDTNCYAENELRDTLEEIEMEVQWRSGEWCSKWPKT